MILDMVISLSFLTVIENDLALIGNYCVHTTGDVEVQQPWFRSDGLVHRQIVDTILTPKLRAAISTKSVDVQIPFPDLIRDDGLSGSKTIVVFTRQSHNDFTSTSSPARQACAILQDLPEEWIATRQARYKARNLRNVCERLVVISRLISLANRLMPSRRYNIAAN